MAGARHFTQLRVWQLGDMLRVEVFRLTSRQVFAAELKTRGQINDAANSVCRNIAEGFGCESHREFARFLEISRRSVNEVVDGLHGAEAQRLLDAADAQPALAVTRRLYPALSRLIAYLRNSDDPRGGSRSRKQR